MRFNPIRKSKFFCFSFKFIYKTPIYTTDIPKETVKSTVHVCVKMVLTMESFSPQGMLDSLCKFRSRINSYHLFTHVSNHNSVLGFTSLHRNGCYEMCQEILDKVKNIQMQDPQFAAAINAFMPVMQPLDRFRSSPLICAVKSR